MSSPHTFLGKVFTLVIGCVLSWLTVMNAEFGAIVATLLGENEPAIVSGPTESERLVSVDHGPADELEPASGSSTLVVYGDEAGEGPINNRQQHPPLLPADVTERNRPTSVDSSGAAVHCSGQIEEIAQRLRHLGASYVLLERLPSSHGDRYRARCDLASDASPVKCCFEATRTSPDEAMYDVLEAVLNVDSHHSGSSKSAVSSM